MQPATTADRMSVSCQVTNTRQPTADHVASAHARVLRAFDFLRRMAVTSEFTTGNLAPTVPSLAEMSVNSERCAASEDTAWRTRREGSAEDVAPARSPPPHRLRLSDDVVQLCCGAVNVAALTQQLARAPALYLHPASGRHERVRVVAAPDGGGEPRQGRHTPNELRAVARAAACCAGRWRQRQGTPVSGASRRDAPRSAACSRLATRLLRTRRNSCSAAAKVSTRGAAPRPGQRRTCVNSSRMSRCRASVCARASPVLVTALRHRRAHQRARIARRRVSEAQCAARRVPAHGVVHVGQSLQQRLDLLAARRNQLQAPPPRQRSTHAPGRGARRAWSLLSPKSAAGLSPPAGATAQAQARRAVRAHAAQVCTELRKRGQLGVHFALQFPRLCAGAGEPPPVARRGRTRTSLRSTSHKHPCAPAVLCVMFAANICGQRPCQHWLCAVVSRALKHGQRSGGL